MNLLHRSRDFVFAVCLLAVEASSPSLRADAPLPPKGLRVLTAGHSFHVRMPGNLIEMAKNAKIEGHQQVVMSSIGGSQVIQHWNVPDDKQKLKPALIASQADVLTLSPIHLPEEGIGNFAKLAVLVR
jgi:hypothetical protein